MLKSLGILASMLVAVSLALGAQAKRPAAGSSSDAAAREKIIKYMRERYNIPETVKMTAGPFRNSNYADFYVTTITVDDGKQKKSQDFYVSRDRRYLVEGTIFTLGADPRQEVTRTIATQDLPGQGPASAPVTIVEYSDLQCPMCARVHELLEKEVLPKYGNRVRVVFKEFPLVAVHDWSLTAAIANQCAYTLNPPLYLPFRSLIFKNQASFNAANVRDLLLTYGEQAGLDRLKLAGCIDSKASLPRVEKDAREGQQLGVSSTPTSFINGKPLVGLPSPEQYFQAIDEALRSSR
jgi:protein-disulfide isomerase